MSDPILVRPFRVTGGEMSEQVANGVALTFERGKKQPVVFSFRTSSREPMNLADKALTFRIGSLGSPAVYELELIASEPATGIATGIVEADVTPASYEYHVDCAEDDRVLVRGSCTVRAVIGPAV